MILNVAGSRVARRGASALLQRHRVNLLVLPIFVRYVYALRRFEALGTRGKHVGRCRQNGAPYLLGRFLVARLGRVSGLGVGWGRVGHPLLQLLAIGKLLFSYLFK